MNDARSMVAGCLFDARRPELGRSLLDLARDVPSRLPMAERLLIHSLIGRVFSRTACLAGIGHLPFVAAAFLSGPRRILLATRSRPMPCASPRAAWRHSSHKAASQKPPQYLTRERRACLT